MKIDIQHIYAIEKELIEKRVALHNRAEHFATLIYPTLYRQKCEDWFGDKEHRRLREFYNSTHNQNTSFLKPFIVGFIASLDRVKTFKIQDIAGTTPLNIYELVGFENSGDLSLFCFYQDSIYQRVMTSIENTLILNNVCIQGRLADEEEGALWREVANHVALTSYALENHFENNTVFQNIHLLAELTIKAVLLNQNVKFKRIHDLSKLIDMLNGVYKEEIFYLKSLVTNFPEFADSRYSGLSNSFIDIIEIALKVQTFVAEVVKYSNYCLKNPIEFAKIEK